jgi:hypothetical protein
MARPGAALPTNGGTVPETRGQMDEHSIARELRTIHRKLDRIMFFTQLNLEEAYFMGIELDNLAAQVRANTDLEQSAILLITGIAQKLKDAAQDPAKVTALAAELKASATDLAAAIDANTEPPPPPAGR